MPTVETANTSSVPDDGGDVAADFLLDFVLEIREHGAHEATRTSREPPTKGSVDDGATQPPVNVTRTVRCDKYMPI